MNLQTPERIAAAAKLVKRGALFSLNAPLDQINPAFYGRGVPRHTLVETPRGGGDDVIDNVYPQASSQWDSLGHACFERDVFYNGVTFADVRAGRNTIDHWARRGIAGRAVLLDVERACAANGRGYTHGTAHPITVDDLEAARKLAKITYQPGDVIREVRTGFSPGIARRAPGAHRDGPRTALQAIGIEPGRPWRATSGTVTPARSPATIPGSKSGPATPLLPGRSRSCTTC